jgi:hypothetical protein
MHRTVGKESIRIYSVGLYWVGSASYKSMRCRRVGCALYRIVCRVYMEGVVEMDVFP